MTESGSLLFTARVNIILGRHTVFLLLFSALVVLLSISLLIIGFCLLDVTRFLVGHASPFWR